MCVYIYIACTLSYFKDNTNTCLKCCHTILKNALQVRHPNEDGKIFEESPYSVDISYHTHKKCSLW